MEFGTTQKGRPTLIYNGRRFVKKRDNKKSGESVWHCVKNKTCDGKVTIKDDAVTREVDHKCVQDESSLRVFKTVPVSNAKQLACDGESGASVSKEQSNSHMQDQPINIKVDKPKYEEMEHKKFEECILRVTQDNRSSPRRDTGTKLREKDSAANQPIHPYNRPLSHINITERLNDIESAVKELKDIVNDKNKPVRTTPCEYELFGQLVTTQLKKLPELNALAAMQQIQACLFEQMVTISSPSAQEQFQPSIPWHNSYRATATTSPDNSQDI